MIENAYARLKAGEEISVVNPNNGNKFNVEAGKWKGIMLGVLIKQNGRIVRSPFMSRGEIEEWTCGLEEVI